MKVKKSAPISNRKIIMKSISIILVTIVLSLSLFGCKTQYLETSVPFEIEEKTYFYWVGGRQGTQGVTISLVGNTESLNVSFSKLFFQYHEYSIVPEYRNDGFLIVGNFSEFRGNDQVTDPDPLSDGISQAQKEKDEFPFDLKDDEAILLYSVNGLEGYHKITGIKQLDKVFRP